MIYRALLHLTLLSTDLLGLNNMSRVTPEEVKEIITTSLGDPVIQVWIDAANTIVNDNADCIGKDEAGLAQIELYLSAHFIGMLAQTGKGSITKEGLPGFETTYASPSNVSKDLDKTTYGTTANMLSGGCLANTNKSVARLFALGN
jgi:hypothetical protein